MFGRGTLSRRVRRGGLVAEALAALAMLGAAAGVFAQLHTLVARQQRASEAHAAASLALANWMERSWSVPFDELDGEHLTKLAALDPLQRQLPDIEPIASVSAEDGQPAGKRVNLMLRWPTADGASPQSVQLTTWRYSSDSPTEDSP